MAASSMSPANMAADARERFGVGARSARRIHPDVARQAARTMIYSSVPPGKKEPLRMETGHTSALTARHAGIEAQIADEIRRPAPDMTLVARLKKQKLKLKEALSRL